LRDYKITDKLVSCSLISTFSCPDWADLGFGKGGCPIYQKMAPRRKARWRCALPGVSRANPENWKFRTLRCIFPAFRGTTTYM